MNCKKCGAELLEDDIFCTSCGSPVKEQEEAVTEQLKEQEEAVTEQLKEQEKTAAEQTEEQPIEQQEQSAAVGARTDLVLEKPEKNDKTALIVMGVIGAAILAALIFLVCSLLGVGSAKTAVKNALSNTMKEFTAEDEYGKALKLLTEGIFTEKMEFSVDNVLVRIAGQELPIQENLFPMRLSFTSTVDNTDKDSDARARLEMTAGMGNMKDIRFELFAREKECLIGLPDLYDKYIRIDEKDIEEWTQGELEPDTDTADEVGEALVKLFSKWASAVNDSVEYGKAGKIAISTDDGEKKAQEYVLTISRKDMEKHVRRLPQMFEEDEVLMDWLSSMYSDSEIQEIIDTFKTWGEESLPNQSVEKIVLGYVAVSDRKAVQIRIPGEPDGSGESLVISFTGKKRVIDHIDFSMNIDDETAPLVVDAAILYNENDGNRSTVELDASVGNFELKLFMNTAVEKEKDSSHSLSEGSVSVQMGDQEAGGASASCDFSMSMSMEKAEALVLPELESEISVRDITEEQAEEILYTILGNIVNGGYIPEEFSSELEALLEYGMSAVEDSMGSSDGDNASGALDGSENLSYEEFAAIVKESYGDVYSEEDLKLLYDSIYGGGAEYDTSGVVYGPSGNPYLFCEDEDLAVELKPVEGFVFSEEYSDAYLVEYEKAIGDSDMIVMSYSMTTDSMEEYLEWEAEFQKEYYEEVGYKIEISELKRGVINTHPAAWMVYSAVDDAGNKSQGIIAYAELDKEHGCVLDMYSLWGEEEVTEEMLYECFDLYYIEN